MVTPQRIRRARGSRREHFRARGNRFFQQQSLLVALGDIHSSTLAFAGDLSEHEEAVCLHEGL
jgi:hypothetical protein